MKPIKVAIIGAGRIAWLLEKDPLRYKPCTHAGALRILAQEKGYQLRFSAIIDPNLKRARALRNFLALSHQKAPLVAPDSTILKEDPPQLIVIAAPSELHCELFQTAIALQPHHIVIEKPIAVTLAQVKKMQLLAKKNNTYIWPNYERRFHPKYQYWKKKINDKLGKFLSYRGLFLAPNEKLFPHKEGEGVLLHDTTHLLDLVQFFFGTITNYHVHYTKTQHLLHCQHQSGVEGSVTTLTNSKAFHLELEILGSKGRLTLGNGFTRWESSQKSQLYSHFYSLTPPTLLPEIAITARNNPFIQLYRQILHHAQPKYNNEYFWDACANVQILLTT